jgi:hypothetical protein
MIFEVLDPTVLLFAPTVDTHMRKTRVLRQTVLGRRLALSHVLLEDDGSWDLNLQGKSTITARFPIRSG